MSTSRGVGTRSEAPPAPQLAIDTDGGVAIAQLKPGSHFTAGYAGVGDVYR